MNAKYKPLSPIPEKRRAESFDSSSTLGDLDYLDLPSRTGKQSLYHNVQPVRTFTASKWIWLLHGVLFMTSCTIFVLAMSVRSTTLSHVQRFSAWSPAESAVRYNTVRYNLTTSGNTFVGAGPAVDEAWRGISYDMGDQWLSKSDFARLGDPETSLMVDHPQTGEAGYRVGMEVFHQLHCLNLLRKVTYKEYYEPLGGEFVKGPEALQMHTDHCIEVLRRNLECNADVGVFSLYMVEGDPEAWPQLNSKHVCRNFNTIREWALDHSVGNME